MQKKSENKKETDPNSPEVERLSSIGEAKRVLREPLEQILRLKASQPSAVSMELLEYENLLRQGLEYLEQAKPTDENPGGNEDALRNYVELAPLLNQYRDYVGVQMKTLDEHSLSGTKMPEYLPSGASDNAFFVNPELPSSDLKNDTARFINPAPLPPYDPRRNN